jgi:hypothetical protein
MPGKRAKNKVRFGGYVESQFYHELAQLAADEGMCNDKFGFVKRLLREALGLPPPDPLAQNGRNHPVKPPASWSGTFTPFAQALIDKALSKKNAIKPQP